MQSQLAKITQQQKVCSSSVSERPRTAVPVGLQNAFQPPVSILGSTCVPPTVNCLQYLATGSTLNGRWAFSVAGPTVWKSLPDFIRDPTISADSFRRLLKTYLFAQY